VGSSAILGANCVGLHYDEESLRNLPATHHILALQPGGRGQVTNEGGLAAQLLQKPGPVLLTESDSAADDSAEVNSASR
jgi:hypothetical protein